MKKLGALPAMPTNNAISPQICFLIRVFVELSVNVLNVNQSARAPDAIQQRHSLSKQRPEIISNYAPLAVQLIDNEHAIHLQDAILLRETIHALKCYDGARVLCHIIAYVAKADANPCLH